MFESSLSLSDTNHVLALFGSRDQNIRMIRDKLGVDVLHQDGKVRVTGEEPSVVKATEVLEQLKDLVLRNGGVSIEDTERLLAGITGDYGAIMSTQIDVINASQKIRPRTIGQAKYIDAINRREVVFALGPAGTGKTYLAVAMAVQYFKHQDVRKIVLVRPAVEAGESLGFLPGDLRAKINPYLRPLLDALNTMLDYDMVKELIEKDVIEVVPLAYMRGRTLDDAFIILDEAQNCSVSQMKMFLTRMGSGSRIVVSGDPTQVDLPPNQKSGLIDAVDRLQLIDGVEVVKLTRKDIVRHHLVQEIVNAYETSGKGRKNPR
ncbi:MAG TPA: PhoH family protein [Planctomycetaceae bacterium]|jgi:phosphate starvation-inducible PhoH-like protein|nr:PhoH family protein [Pirellulales bacterium]HCK72354.1 PhoH family protein [Planctomycetaceae bacterium]HCP84185.1 PhoH family protein [Planctomycetaceae bacterium]|tara:strand:- start:376 stop:1332 length:957 start_codon:yes stop_codon:yes gene_type:complete